MFIFDKLEIVLNLSYCFILQDFIDIVLSKTQRKTPTEVHKQYAIGRIRQFYMKKVKFTQQNFHDKLTAILDDFPKLDVSTNYYTIISNSLSLIYSCQLMCFVLVNNMNYFCSLRQSVCEITYRLSAK